MHKIIFHKRSKATLGFGVDFVIQNFLLVSCFFFKNSAGGRKFTKNSLNESYIMIKYDIKYRAKAIVPVNPFVEEKRL